MDANLYEKNTSLYVFAKKVTIESRFIAVLTFHLEKMLALEKLHFSEVRAGKFTGVLTEKFAWKCRTVRSRKTHVFWGAISFEK